MSVVCVKVKPKVIEVASDSILVSGWTQSKSQNNFAKLVEVNGLVVGGAGVSEECAQFQVFCSTRRPEQGTEAGLMSFLSDFAEWRQKRFNTHLVENHYLVITEGKVFQVESFFVQEITTYAAIGAGSDFALAALHLGQDVQKAVEVACELSVYCEPPIRYMKVSK